ncbi:O-methyltransferase [Bacillus sp. AG4(2022)]|uniref:O-methyltransferase n=1 Tax=Bacillus sp. AG4(2022) TaxID=2962594 RepID=UPI0028819E94|nr:O-methyltransferase [Bacillus sp. AG4(2022)]MDT0161986.1 O-methyltransferase [Bacillus sp. AG4(2022)]
MLTDKVHGYIEGLIPERPGLFLEMEEYAKDNGVPIMELPGIEALLQLLRIQKPKQILEVGAAIGYSALRMSFAIPDAHIVTIERDEERIESARGYIRAADREDQITLLEGDALELEGETSKYGPYDAVFIDAAKGQYKKFFEIYARQLSDGGLIITDNVLFKGLVCESEIENKRIRSLVKKISEFNAWLMNHPDYDTVILPVGDGVAISKKR